jgi:hypothetical protein
MAIRKAIKTYLAALTGVTATCAGRVYWLAVRDAAKLPCVIFHVTGGGSASQSCGPDGPKYVDVEVWALSRDAEESIALGDEITGASGLHGVTFTEDSTTVQLSVLSEVLQDDYLEEPFSAYACGAVFRMQYQ